MTEICFDNYVADMNDIEDNINGYSDVNKDKNCSYFEGKSPDRSRLDIINIVSPHDGCCFSTSENKNTINITNNDDLDSYIQKLKNDYKRIFPQTRSTFDTIIDSETLELYSKKRTVAHLKNVAPNLMKQYQRLFLGVEQDEGKIKKLIQGFENTNPFNDIQTFQNENRKHKEFRDLGTEEQKIFFYDRTSYATYEAFFYAMLSIVGILFLRTQLKN